MGAGKPVLNGRLSIGNSFSAEVMAVRARLYAGAVGPLILFVDVGVGTLYMQAIEDRLCQLFGGGQQARSHQLSDRAPHPGLCSRRRHQCTGFGDAAQATRISPFVADLPTSPQTTAAILVAIVLGSLAALATGIPFSMVRTSATLAPVASWLLPALPVVALVLGVSAVMLPTMLQLRGIYRPVR